jgi:hypothetical protein
MYNGSVMYIWTECKYLSVANTTCLWAYIPTSPDNKLVKEGNTFFKKGGWLHVQWKRDVYGNQSLRKAYKQKGYQYITEERM